MHQALPASLARRRPRLYHTRCGPPLPHAVAKGVACLQAAHRVTNLQLNQGVPGHPFTAAPSKAAGDGGPPVGGGRCRAPRLVLARGGPGPRLERRRRRRRRPARALPRSSGRRAPFLPLAPLRVVEDDSAARLEPPQQLQGPWVRQRAQQGGAAALQLPEGVGQHAQHAGRRRGGWRGRLGLGLLGRQLRGLGCRGGGCRDRDRDGDGGGPGRLPRCE
jgi:hypothetical protein